MDQLPEEPMADQRDWTDREVDMAAARRHLDDDGRPF